VIDQQKDKEEFMYCIDPISFYYLDKDDLNPEEKYNLRVSKTNYLVAQLHSGRMKFSEFLRRLQYI
jgi:hypothetical protein